MLGENIKKVHSTVRTTVTALVIYGVAVILYYSYVFFAGIIQFGYYGSAFLSGYLTIIWLIVSALFFFMILLFSFMLFSASKLLLENKKEGASMGMGGVLVLAVPGSIMMYTYLYEDDMLLIPLLWLIFNIFLISFLKKSKKILSK